MDIFSDEKFGLNLEELKKRNPDKALKLISKAVQLFLKDHNLECSNLSGFISGSRYSYKNKKYYLVISTASKKLLNNLENTVIKDSFLNKNILLGRMLASADLQVNQDEMLHSNYYLHLNLNINIKVFEFKETEDVEADFLYCKMFANENFLENVLDEISFTKIRYKEEIKDPNLIDIFKPFKDREKKKIKLVCKKYEELLDDVDPEIFSLKKDFFIKNYIENILL